MKVFIIAEAGVNHNGCIETAKKLIDVAVDAGADAVKFQTFKAKNLVTKSVEQADYQVKNTGITESQFDMLKRLEISASEHAILFEYCAIKKIEFMSTPFDDDSIELLHNLGVQKWKIPSGELLSIPYLRKIAKFNEYTVLSTGMASQEDVELSVNTLLKAGLEKKNLIILHANTAYPTPFKDVNLRAMQTLKNRFLVGVGLSDHSLGIEVPIAAVAMGAIVIEKHFTLDKTMAGPDHKASLDPNQLKTMVKSIRNIELALGDGVKQVSASELSAVKVARKRIVSKKKICKGERFSLENLTIKRSNNGVFSQHWDSVIGLISKSEIGQDMPIQKTDY